MEATKVEATKVDEPVNAEGANKEEGEEKETRFVKRNSASSSASYPLSCVPSHLLLNIFIFTYIIYKHTCTHIHTIDSRV